ncbi:MAG: nucleotidyltransferase family protein [Leptospiraceae bacterium]|nr:nucleotidyltransferase family protein [Leptospiraceae bacterium]
MNSLFEANLKEIVTGYFQKKPVIKAYLFGSYSRGDNTESSDIDILVELDYTEKIGLAFFKMENDLSNLLQTKVDLLTTNSISKYIKPYVEKEKKLIYERKEIN